MQNEWTSKQAHTNATDVADIPTAAIITVAFRQIITCFPAAGGGWAEGLMMCVCVCAFVPTDISGVPSRVLGVLFAYGMH